MPATGLDDRASLAQRLGFGISVISGGAALPPGVEEHHGPQSAVRSPQSAAGGGHSDRLGLGAYRPWGDHRRQVLDELTGHLLRDPAVPDDNFGAQGRHRDARATQQRLDFAATAQVRRSRPPSTAPST